MELSFVACGRKQSQGGGGGIAHFLNSTDKL
jgi:hypothetical protein